MTPSLGWQSWSPPYPSPLKFPRRDYSPIPLIHYPLSITHRSQVHLSYWCSWYALGYFPSPDQIVRQAKLIREHRLPITHILLDDGWREPWLPTVISSLRQLGFKVGLWYAPFHRHQAFPLPQNLDRLIGSYKLDLLKLDFLYQPYFHPSLYPRPSQTLTSLFDHLKGKFPQLTTIGCGVPFSDAVGRLDIIRLSKDTALPYPTPRFINVTFYTHRLKMLSEKYVAWTANQPFTPDPDVRMFGLDTKQTNLLWGKMSYQIKGLGDDLSKLNASQLKTARQWLTK